MTVPLALSGIRKAFGGKTVLRGLDVAIEAGEIFGVLGPSGAGKTTVLRLLDLLETPDAGDVLFEGRALRPGTREALAQRRRMCLIAQNPTVFRATVFENVAYGLWLRGVPEEDIRGRVFAALDFVGLLDRSGELAGRLSGGEQQRVAFARATVLRPEVLLLDEFTSNLDPANVRLLESATRRYRAETGCTVVIVTHNLFQAKRLAERVGLLLDGAFVEVGPTHAVFENPSRRETQAFLSGEMAY
ncbi:MAG TPA: phosphate ABC transporter ATP-binding protein [Thermoplasmata archaeon]|nr:phosphate ABC transporter ATP-binding protein [Thermoplasmata archaeon]